MKQPNRYQRIIEHIFKKHYRRGAGRVDFTREDLTRAAHELQIPLPKNLGDVVYSFRYRSDFPDSINRHAPQGASWIIRPAGRGLYRFVVTRLTEIKPNEALAETKVPDATPGIIEKYAREQEQALLAKVRYNRLIDIFTGLTCYSLQSHLQTSVSGLGQIETDELYVGVDRRGVHYILPVQAKGGRDRLSPVQIEQDLAMCAKQFGSLVCRPVAAQFMEDDLIALFEFEQSDSGIAIAGEKHYRLVPPEEVKPEDLAKYQARPSDER